MGTEFVELWNQKTNERKAIEYSKSVRKQRTKMLLFRIFAILFLCFSIAYVSNEEFEDVYAAESTTEKISETEVEETYLICDVDNYVYNADFEGATELGVIMPNGDYEWYSIYDAPEDKCELVVFKTNNLEDYTTYEVVALR